jgi:hypothetical protein
MVALFKNRNKDHNQGLIKEIYANHSANKELIDKQSIEIHGLRIQLKQLEETIASLEAKVAKLNTIAGVSAIQEGSKPKLSTYDQWVSGEGDKK